MKGKSRARDAPGLKGAAAEPRGTQGELGASESPGSAGHSSRHRVLARISRAVARREKRAHPGQLQTPQPPDPVVGFARRFSDSGGRVVTANRERHRGEWLTTFMKGLNLGATVGVAVGTDVPPEMRPNMPEAPPDRAAAGVVLAWGAIAETGSLILEPGGGRAVQLLPPVLFIWVPVGRILGRMEDALLELQTRLPATVALHSGPSKSADIGRTVVTGVHGPGRCIAVLDRTPSSLTPLRALSVRTEAYQHR